MTIEYPKQVDPPKDAVAVRLIHDVGQKGGAIGDFGYGEGTLRHSEALQGQPHGIPLTVGKAEGAARYSRRPGSGRTNFLAQRHRRHESRRPAHGGSQQVIVGNPVDGWFRVEHIKDNGAGPAAPAEVNDRGIDLARPGP